MSWYKAGYRSDIFAVQSRLSRWLGPICDFGLQFKAWSHYCGLFVAVLWLPRICCLWTRLCGPVYHPWRTKTRVDRSRAIWRSICNVSYLFCFLNGWTAVPFNFLTWLSVAIEGSCRCVIILKNNSVVLNCWCGKVSELSGLLGYINSVNMHPASGW